MAHVRRQIREYFNSYLTVTWLFDHVDVNFDDVSGLFDDASDNVSPTSAGSNVFESRVYPMQSAKLPAILIYTTSEASEEVAFSKKRVQERLLDVQVEGYIRAITGFDDKLDLIASEVETAILADPTLGGLALNTVLSGTEAEYSGDAEQPVGTIRLTFQVQYRTETGYPDSAI